MKPNILPSPGICSHVHIILVLLFFSFHASSQQVIKFIPSQERKAVFNNYYSQYAVGTMDVAQTVTLLQSTNRFDSLTLEANGTSYAFSLEANDVRSSNYVLRVMNGSSIEQMPRSPNKTWTGITLEGNMPVCITADEQFFSAMITTAEGPLFIESAKLADPSAANDQFVIYHERNVLQNPENSTCGVVDFPANETPVTDSTANRSMMLCVEVDVAIANDNLMFQKYTSVGMVEVQNLAVINLVNTNFDNEFSMTLKHKVTEIVVVTGTNPWYSGTDANALLNSFTAWVPQFVTDPDVATLWTNRDLDGSTVGLAWVDQLCGIKPHHILQDFSPVMAKLRATQAHEIGHNYGCQHDTEPGYIMYGSVSESNQWSPTSITVITQEYIQNGICFAFCPPAPFGQVGIGTTSPHGSSVLDISSTDKGLLIPRLTPVQRNAIPYPAEGLTVYDTHTKSFWFYDAAQWVEIIDGTDFQKQATHMSFGQAGNVGIGLTVPPLNKLDIATQERENLDANVHPTNLPVYITGTSPSYKGLEVRNIWADRGVGLEASNDLGPNIYSTGWVDNVPLTLSTKGLSSLNFRTNNTERMRLTGNGSLGIGTVFPDGNALLDISSTSKGILIPRMNTAERTAISNPTTGLLVFDNTTNSFWYKGSSAWVELSDNLDQEVYRNGPDKIYMGLTDSVGIGTNAPKYKLDVKTGSGQYGFAHTDGMVELASWVGQNQSGEIGTVSNHTLRLFAGDGGGQFSLLPNGNIGIGLFTAANKFDIRHGDLRTGDHAMDRPLYVTGNLGNASNGAEFRHANGTQGIGIGFNTLYAAGSLADHNIGLQAKGTGNVLVTTGGVERFRFTSTGRLGIGVTNVNAQLHMSNDLGNRKIILYEGGNDEHQYYGFGVNGSTLRYQVDHPVSAHVFYAAVDANSSNELMRIRGNGNVLVSGTVEVEAVIIPTLLNNFTQYGNGYANAGFYKDKMGRVHLRGTVNNVNNPTGLVIFNLPVGYRPTSGRLINTVNANGATGRVDIMPNGDLMVMTGAAGWVNLDGISFRAD